MVHSIEVAALKRVMRSKPNITNVTQKQIYALVMLFQEAIPGLSKRDRIAMMDYIIGDIMWDLYDVKVTSFKNMTSNIASVLINEISESVDGKLQISEQGREFLLGCKAAIEVSATKEQEPANGAGVAVRMSSM